MRLMAILFPALLIAAVVACATAPGNGVIVETQSGSVTGIAADGIQVYKGIAYAEAPVGELRWKPPAAKAKWDGVFAADTFGPACVQPRPRMGSIYANPPDKISEDCLSLNIWTPDGAEQAPVFVWIHGGSLTAGYNSERMYDGARLARENGLIVVTINYRLGVLGYLAHPELSAESADGVSGNYGVLDQIEALRWVERNIAAFGGDPDNVTIAGESAGALSVLYLMTSPAARNLFDKAIVQSGYMISAPELKSARHGHFAAEDIGVYVAGAVKADGLAGLRAMDAEALTAAAAKAGFAPLGTIDGKVLPRQLVDTFERGEQAPVPVIAGFNSGEIRSLGFLAPPPPKSAADYETAIRERYGDLAEDFLAQYPSGDLKDAVLAAPRDSLYGWTATRIVRDQGALGQPGYLYYFDHTYPAASDLDLRGFHAAEIPYVFGTTHLTPPFWPKVPATAREQTLSDALGGYWASFARSGVPTAPGAPVWMPYAEGRAHLNVEGSVSAGANLLPGMFELHDETVCRRRAAGDQQWNWNTGIVAPVLPAADETCR